MDKKQYDKPQNRKYVLLRLFKYLMRHWLLVLLALVLAISGNLLALSGPKLSGSAIDLIEKGAEAGSIDLEGVFNFAWQMLLVYVLSSVFSYLLSVTMLTISRRVTYSMRKDIFYKITSLPVSYFDTRQVGDILSRISYDVDTINASLSHDFVQILASTITITGAFIMMMTIAPTLVLVFLFTIPLSIYTTYKKTKITRPMFRKRSEKLGMFNGFVEEIISGQKTLKVYCREESTIAKHDAKNKETVDAYYESEYHSSKVGPTVNFINNLSFTLIAVFGSLLYMMGNLSVGDISSFVLYSRKFSGPINEIANIFGELQSALSAAERVFKLLDELPEAPDRENAVEMISPRGDIRLDNVSFGYSPDKTVLKDLSLDAPGGSLIAIVGPTGAGKTTLINLLMRFYDVDEGDITLDGVSVYDITRSSLRASYAMVLQDTWLFNGTVAENIGYGKEGASREEIVSAGISAGIDGFINRLPGGYDAVINDDATNISKGQKQLITIARAMLTDAKMLILDEATSNVDTTTEIKIREAMRKLMKDKTCFIVAHRLSTIKNADKILVMRGGNVVESGTHQELLSQNGFYSELFRSQFE